MERPICSVCNIRVCEKSTYKPRRNKPVKHFKNKCQRCRKGHWGHNKDRFKLELDKCCKCGFIPVDECQLDIDHIDGNNKNRDSSNLQVLCANCHRLKTKLNKDGIYKDRQNFGGEMTKEKLEAKLREYQAALDQLKANANAMQGAIQAVQQLITEIDAEAATQTKVE